MNGGREGLYTTHPQRLSQREVGEEDVRLQHVADVTSVLAAQLRSVQRHRASGQRQVARQAVEQGGLAGSWG